MSTTKNTGRENINNQQGGEKKGQLPESGVNYFIKVDGVVLKTDTAILKAFDVLVKVGLSEDTHQLVRVFQDGRKEILPGDAVVDLNGYGVEEFQTEKRLVEVFYKNQPFKLQLGDVRVTELKKIFGLPQACHLSVLVGDELKPLPDDGFVCIRGGEHFASYPCDGKAS